MMINSISLFTIIHSNLIPFVDSVLMPIEILDISTLQSSMID